MNNHIASNIDMRRLLVESNLHACKHQLQMRKNEILMTAKQRVGHRSR
mgnify:CR=1 FL=1